MIVQICFCNNVRRYVVACNYKYKYGVLYVIRRIRRFPAVSLTPDDDLIIENLCLSLKVSIETTTIIFSMIAGLRNEMF